MTHDEILALGERELYETVVHFASPKIGIEVLPIIAKQCEVHPITHGLSWCYQAEEKLDSMGLKKQRGHKLWEILFGERQGLRIDDKGWPIATWDNIADVAKAHPKQRAQAILMTIYTNEGGR